jgi:hypothetical protein
MEKTFNYEILVSNTLNPEPNFEVVCKVVNQGDAFIILSALCSSVRQAPLDYTIKKLNP